MVIEAVYKVFGDNLPKTRSAYSAVVAKPFPVLTITKEFKNWEKFVKEYAIYCVTQRNFNKPSMVQKRSYASKKS